MGKKSGSASSSIDGVRIEAKVYFIILLSMLAVAALIIYLVHSARHKPVVVADLNRPETIRATRAKGLFPAFRGKIARIGPHYLLYPLAVFPYEPADGEQSRLVGRPSPETPLTGKGYVPAIAANHPLVARLKKPLRASAEKPRHKSKAVTAVSRGLLEKLARVPFDFVVRVESPETMGALPRGIVFVRELKVEPLNYMGESRASAALRKQLPGTDVEKLFMIQKEETRYYGMAMILCIMSFIVFLIWIAKLGKYRRLLRRERTADREFVARSAESSSGNALARDRRDAVPAPTSGRSGRAAAHARATEMAKNNERPRGPAPGEEDPAYDFLFGEPPRDRKKISKLVKHNLKEKNTAFRLAPLALVVMPVKLLYDQEWSWEGLIVGLIFGVLVALVFVYFGFFHELLRGRGMAILRFGIAYPGIIGYQDTHRIDDGDQYDIMEVYFDDEEGPRTAKVMTLSQDARDIAVKGAEVVVLVDPRKVKRVAVYAGKAGLLQGRSTPRKS